MDPTAKQEVQPQAQQQKSVPAASVLQPAQQPVTDQSHPKFEAVPYPGFPWAKVIFIILMIGVIFLLAALGLLFYTKSKQASIIGGPVQHLSTQPTIAAMTTNVPIATAQVDKDFWRTDTSSFSAEELQSLQQLLLKGGEPQGGKLVVIYIEKMGNFGEISTAIIDKTTNKPLGTEPGFVALYKDANNNWNLLLTSDPNFCNKIKTFPSIIADSARTFFCSN